MVDFRNERDDASQPGGSRESAESVQELLELGGLSLSEPQTTRFEPTLDPKGTEHLVGQLARKVSGTVDQLAAWDEPEDLVLAHALGLALGITWIRCTTDGTAISLSEAPRRGGRVGLVTDFVRPSLPVRLIDEALRQGGAKRVILFTLLADPEGADALPVDQVMLAILDRGPNANRISLDTGQ